MAERNGFGDLRSGDIVRSENSSLVRDIIRNCQRGDYKKSNVLLVGQSGSGKSSVVNTIRKAIIGQYVHVAEAGAGEVPSNTLQLNWYPNCGASEDDFKDIGDETHVRAPIQDKGTYRLPPQQTMRREESLGPIHRKLPDIFDVAGMADSCSDDTKEILRLLFGGYIPPGTDIEMVVQEQCKIGTGYLTKKYNNPQDEWKISVLLFACDCGSPIPNNLIKCVREVLGEANQRTLCKRYDIDVYLLLTKYDKVALEFCPSPKTVKTKSSSKECDSTEMIASEEDTSTQTTQKTRSKFEEIEKAVTDAFVISGTEDQTRLRWTSYNNSVGFDNPYIDNKSLQLLKFITTPKRFRRQVVPELNSLHEWKAYTLFQMEKMAKYSFNQLKQGIRYLAFELQQYLLHNYRVDLPQVWLLVGISMVLLLLVYFILSFSLFSRA